MSSIAIESSNLKNYVSSYKSASFTNQGCKLEPKTARVSFDLSCFSNISKIEIIFKRISGNGLIVINDTRLSVVSKVSQKFYVNSKTFEIYRPENSVGDICIIGLSLEAEFKAMNWKSIINRCGKYSCLRMVDNRLFASIGGLIENGSIINLIETNPPNSFVREGDKIKFNSSCEITNIILGDAPQVVKNTEIFVNRTPPTPMHLPNPHYASKRIKTPDGNPVMTNTYEHRAIHFDDYIVYDSSSIKNFQQFLASKDKIKQIKSNNSCYLVVRQGGKSNAPISNLLPDTDYICIINGKRLNGNGRLYCGASCDENFTNEGVEVVFGGNFSNRYVSFRTGPNISDKVQRFHLFMTDRLCTGELLLQRIVIVRDLEMDQARDGLEGRRYVPTNEVLRPEIVQTSFGHSMEAINYDDKVYENSKRYALYPQIPNVEYLNSMVRGNILTNNIPGVMWVSKVKSVMKHIRVIDDKSEFGSNSLFVGYVGSLKPSKHIWLEYFNVDTQFSETDMNILKSAEFILTPSTSNAEILRSMFGGKRIEVSHRPIPWVIPKHDSLFSNMDFVLSFDRNTNNTNILLQSWSNELPKLVIVGGRGNYPDFVCPVNEYYPYDKLLFLIQKCRFIIDLPESCDYHSAFLDIAIDMGKPILSTNWFVNEKKNCALLNQNFNQDIMQSEVAKMLNIISDLNSMDSYNDKFLRKAELFM